jgi:predicted RNase H-like nuclease (RuvC/YqgF family)
MSKITVVFSNHRVVIDGRFPWMDSEGNKTQPESCKYGDVFEELKELKQRAEKAEAENAELKKQLSTSLADMMKHKYNLNKMKDLEARQELLSQRVYELKFCINKIRNEVDPKVVDRWVKASLSFHLEEQER